MEKEQTLPLVLQPETIYQDDYIRVELDIHAKYIYTEWLQHPSSDDFRKSFEKATELTITHGCHYWMSDSRAIHYLEFADQNWMLGHILPQLPKSSLQKFARITTFECLSLMDISRILATLEEVQGSELKTKLQLFTSKEDALNWLSPTP
jgi:hypothetical protein